MCGVAGDWLRIQRAQALKRSGKNTDVAFPNSSN